MVKNLSNLPFSRNLAISFQLNFTNLIPIDIIWISVYFPSHAPNPIGKRVADDSECPDFSRILNMVTDACACIVITYADDSQGLRCIFRQFAQVHCTGSHFTRHEFDCDIHVQRYGLIYLGLDLSDFFRSRLRIQNIIAFRLLSFYVCISRTRASEHLHHSGVQKMLSAMSLRMLNLVM